MLGLETSFLGLRAMCVLGVWPLRALSDAPDRGRCDEDRRVGVGDG